MFKIKQMHLCRLQKVDQMGLRIPMNIIGIKLIGSENPTIWISMPAQLIKSTILVTLRKRCIDFSGSQLSVRPPLFDPGRGLDDIICAIE